MTRKSLAKRSLARLLKWAWLTAMFFIVLSASAVLLLRWLPPPTAGIVVQRQWEESHSGNVHYLRWTPWEEMAPELALAVIAAEDQRFFHHWGFDFDQLQKAIDANRGGARLRGASTISQQTAKNLFLWNGRSYLRKGLEAWFTLLLETLWPKQRILEVYLNIVEFGPGVYGVAAAGQHHFDKTPSQINRSEAALLAAVLPNPHRMQASRPSPYVLERQEWILDHMNRLGGHSALERNR